jgi:hypothetical protein
MNNATFALRKQAMAFIYEAKNLVPTLPRINIRITEKSESIMGVGSNTTTTIWLTEDTVNSARLKEIVYHEIVHAAFGLGHFEGCKLMDASASLNPTSSELDSLLVHYSKAA